MKLNRKLIVRGSALVLLLLAGIWVLLNPNNPLTRLFRGKISDTDARVVTGPYPTEEDFRVLQSNGVTLIVSLLDPTLPYESVLLDRERATAQKYDMRLVNFPMGSIFGKRMGAYYEKNANEAAEAAAREPGKVYMHCYLGLHRVKVVTELLRTKQASVATYLQARGERSNQARLLDEAQAEYDAGRYSAALDTLKQMLELSPTARILQAWATYRLGNIAPARALFNEISQASSNNNDARAGVAYCALRENDLAAADSQFAMIMKDNPNDPAALFGLGLVRYRQGRLREAATSLESSIKIDSTNEEARAILKRIRIAPNRGEVK